jgi:hypothetical protein
MALKAVFFHEVTIFLELEVSLSGLEKESISHAILSYHW